MKNIGFIGLGNMGKGMSINLSKSNYNVIGYDIEVNRYKFLEGHNIKFVQNIKSLVEDSEIIITMLPNGKIVKKVWMEVLKYANEGQYLIDCSTIDVETSIFIQTEGMKKGILTLDAPVSGGVIGADNASLTFMVGGKDKTYNDTSFLFDVMGKKSILCGGIGAGQSAKICNNMLLATTMVAVGESFKLGEKLGLDLNKLFEVLSTSTGSCWAINTYCPIKGIGPNSPSDNDYTGGFSSALMCKDLGLAVDAIEQTGLDLKYCRETFKNYKRLVDHGKGNLDFSIIVKNLN